MPGDADCGENPKDADDRTPNVTYDFLVAGPSAPTLL